MVAARLGSAPMKARVLPLLVTVAIVVAVAGSSQGCSSDTVTVACACKQAPCVEACFEEADLDSSEADAARADCEKGGAAVVAGCTGTLTGICSYTEKRYRYYDATPEASAICQANGGVWASP